MELSGLTEHLEAVEAEAALVVPWRGKTYTFPPPGPARRMRCAALLAAYTRPPGEERAEAIAAVLGDDDVEVMVLGEEGAARVKADDLPLPVRIRLVTVAAIYWTQGEEMAKRYLESSAAGEQGPKAPARSTRRTTGTRTGAASTTRRRASTSGTKPRQSASRARAGKAQGEPSTGGTS